MPGGQPYLTGGTVIAMKYKDGVLLAADQQMCFGSLKAINNYNRIIQLNSHCIMSFSGDEADMKSAIEVIKEKNMESICELNRELTPKAIHGIMAMQNYKYRNNGTPFLNTFMIAGADFLGLVDLYGMNCEMNYYASSMGKYFCIPLLNTHWKKDLTKEQAYKIVEMCIDVMYKNDKLAGKKFTVGYITKDNITIEEHEIPYNYITPEYRDLIQFI